MKASAGTAASFMLVLLILAPLHFAGCGSDDDTPSQLFATWQLQEFVLDGGERIDVPAPQDYTVEFKEDGLVSVRADCNNCSGSYTVNGSSLAFGPLACTRAACPPGSLDLQFLTALGTVSSFEIVDGSLFLNYEGGEMRFIAPVVNPL